MTQTTLAFERTRGAWWQQIKASDSMWRASIFILSLACAMLLWSFLAWWIAKPAFLPSPEKTLEGGIELIKSGDLQMHVLTSFMRIIVGFVVGTLVGIPLGLAMGSSQFVRAFMDPYVEFFRFIPPIAFVTLAVIWFGLGETSKIILIVYTTVFMVAINTMIGVLGVEPDKRFAALCLGGTEWQVFAYVTIPAVIPSIVTGMKIAMGNSFMTVVSAEMVSAKSGVGFLIYNSRLFLLTEWIFVGIITLGVMGFVTDRALRLAATTLLRRYDVRI
jgi:ABC-type nitrate/sulfonate/bicarbonate transport system permease component